MSKDKLFTPDLDWFTKISREQKVTIHCPFTTTTRCPRYYQSLSLLGKEGICTKIPPDEDKRLLEEWKNSDLWPRVNEEATSIKNKKFFKNFCPEVSFEVFGLFAKDLFENVIKDDTDERRVHNYLETNNIPVGHWLRTWSHITQQHFTECSLFSILESQKHEISTEAQDQKNNEKEHSIFSHSPDYRSITFMRQPFSLTSRQAQIIEILHNAYKDENPDLGLHYILDKLATPDSRLKDTFRSRPGIWGNLIIEGKSKGTYRLNI